MKSIIFCLLVTFACLQTESVLAAPGAFTLSSATPGCSGSSPEITLTWTASTGATSYNIYRNGSIYAQSVTGLTYENVGANVVAGTTYSYYIYAVNSVGATESGNTLSATAPSNCGAVPGVPVLTLTAECSGTTSQIRLNWTQASGATSYDIYRNFAVYMTGVTGTQFINTSVTPGTTYSYSVLARNSNGSTGSATQSATAPSNCGDPGAFTLSSATPGCSGSSPEITLTWTASTGATSYNIYRNGSIYAQSVTGLTYENVGANVVAGTTYSYYIYAVNSVGATESGNTLSATAPSNCGGTSALSITTTAFNPATATVGTGYAALQAVTATGGQTPYSWSASGLPNGMAINSSSGAPFGTPTVSGTFNVTVTVTDSSSPQKTASKMLSISVASGTTVSMPTVQTLAATLVTVNSAQLNGSINPNGASTSAYFEYGTTTSYGSPTPTDNLGTTFQNINYTITGLSPNTTYHYRVVASNNNGINRGADMPFQTAAVPAQGSTVSGQIFDGSTGSSLSGVTVQLSGGSPTTTDANGNFSFASVAVNTYTLTASKTGYGTFTGTISVTAGSSPFQTIRLNPTAASTSPPVITSVGSQYSGALYFLDGISFPIIFTANVDWAGHPPSVVRFITPKGGNFNVSTSGSTASQSIDVGSDFGPGGQLQVVAISSDGSQSVATVANFVVMPPIPSVNFQLAPNGNQFYYKSAQSLRIPFIDDGLPSGVSIPGDIPLFGGDNFDLMWAPEIDTTVNGNNATFVLSGVSADATFDLGPIDPALEGLDVNFSVEPSLDVSEEYIVSSEYWQLSGGGIGLKLDAGLSKTFNLSIPIAGQVFAKADIDLSLNGILNVVNLNPVELNGTLDVAPKVTGTLGIGNESTFAVEGSVSGGCDFLFEYPNSPALISYELTLTAGASVYALGSDIVDYNKTWTWPSQSPNLQTMSLLSLNKPSSPHPWPRDYLKQISYGAFNGNPNTGFHPLIKPLGQPSNTQNPLLYSLQTQIFPFSESSISANGTNCYAVWLYDNPSRTLNNRTMLVFSKFDGTQWNTFSPVADDGTADYHPQLKTFADGSAVVAWENEGTILSTNATFTDITTNLEIATAFYNPIAGAWQPMQQLTANSYLDQSPRIAGSSENNLMLVWVANTNNDLEGGSTNINQLWFSTWNGSEWSTPQIFANVPYPLLKCSLSYDGVSAYVVMSLDSDNTLTNVNADELFEVAYQNGSWGSLQQLTTNQVPDDSPQMAIDPNGHIVLVWLQGNALSSVVDFNFANQQVVRTNEYSSNLGDFRLANSSDGRLAVLWAEPSQQYSSDLWGMFYDPNFEVWGNPKQLTADPETEMETAATFFSTNQLVALYDRVDIAIGNTNQIGSVISNADLYVLQYQLTNNLALIANSLTVSPANPAPGDTVTLSVMAENLGDSTVSNVLVAFYQGDPANGGTEIGEASLLGSLAPNATVNVEIGWTVPATTNSLPIYAVIDPSQQFSDSDLLNNEVTNTFVEPDLAVQSVTWSQITSNLLSVTATVINQGTIASQPATVSFMLNSLTGTSLFSTNIASLAPGQSIDVNFLWNVPSLGNGVSLFTVVNGVTNALDFNPQNNALELTIQPDITQVNVELGPVLLLSGGVVQVGVNGLSGQTYPIQVSTNLVNWDFLTNMTLTNSAGQFIDSSAGNFKQRFYRAVLP